MSERFTLARDEHGCTRLYDGVIPVGYWNTLLASSVEMASLVDIVRLANIAEGALQEALRLFLPQQCEERNDGFRCVLKKGHSGHHRSTDPEQQERFEQYVAVTRQDGDQ